MIRPPLGAVPDRGRTSEDSRQMKRNPFTLEFLLSRTLPVPPPEYCTEFGDCAIWRGVPDDDGYGRASFVTDSGRKTWRVHIASYVVVNGPVPSGLCVCHRCDRPLCIAPNHLVAQTVAANMHDKSERDRVKKSYGMQNGSAKFTDSQIRAIRKDSRPQWLIAEHYGVHENTISCIVRRITWTHVS